MTLALRAAFSTGWTRGWPPFLELVAGCIVLVLSAGFWIDPGEPIWRDVFLTAGAIRGPVFVYRAWKRKASEMRYVR